jgi:hypothetical protein
LSLHFGMITVGHPRMPTGISDPMLLTPASPVHPRRDIVLTNILCFFRDTLLSMDRLFTLIKGHNSVLPLRNFRQSPHRLWIVSLHLSFYDFAFETAFWGLLLASVKPKRHSFKTWLFNIYGHNLIHPTFSLAFT